MQALKSIMAVLGIFLAVGSLVVVDGCSPGSSGTDTASAQDVPIAYVKRPINAQSMNSAVGNPTDSVTFHAGGDLYVRDISSPSASERNITSVYTQGRGDVSDPEVSYDGKLILFSMKGPGDSTWNIWEYDREADTLRRVIPDDAAANQGDDVDPAYLPDGRIVFSSNRQQKTVQTAGYRYVDEYDRETSTVLHVMNADGKGKKEIQTNKMIRLRKIILKTTRSNLSLVFKVLFLTLISNATALYTFKQINNVNPLILRIFKI